MKKETKRLRREIKKKAIKVAEDAIHEKISGILKESKKRKKK